MASPSLRSNNRWNHDVFLSFRGPDTRNTFTGHLHQALLFKGINVFIDTELQRGEVITSQLLRVIEESRISIVVLSEKYASSSFCLDELEKILEIRQSKGQIVIPVFYHVDPTDVEEQRGVFGQEFVKLEAQLNKHLNSWKLFPSIASSFLRNFSLMSPTVDDLNEQRNNDEETAENIIERVQKWRLALTEIARLSGWHLENGNHESNIIQKIVKEVWKKLDYTPLQVADHPVGLTSRVEYIVRRLKMESQDVCMLGLHGMGGVGKTTIARALYNIYACHSEFEGSCFLSKVRENTKKHGIANLQQILLSKILREQGYLIENSEEGIELIKRRLQSKKVFIVIDDVDHLEQLQQLVGGLEWFGGGSIIIITTRNTYLLEQHGATMILEIKEMYFDEALELFSWYAFKEAQPNEAYMELSNHVIRKTRGLPLALKVLGSSLYKRSAQQWDDMLAKLKRVSNEIDEVLKVSYESLDSEEKAIFLDIAIFFKGKDKDEVTKFLDLCGFGAHLGIERLIQNSLVYVDSYGKLEMHDLLEMMGTKISLNEFSRLYVRERDDILRLFVNDKRAYDVEILVLDLNGEEEVPLKWLQNLTNLRALAVRNGRFIKMPKKLTHGIRWLEWCNSCLSSIPSGFLPPNLLVLEMPYCNIKTFSIVMPKAQKFMNLSRMDLANSKNLREIVVDFSFIPNIEVLDLSECRKLKKVHKSVGSLKNLEKLNLFGCCSLTSLPNLIDNQCLESLHLTDCSKLENLPNLPTSIALLHMDYSGIKEIPLFIGNLINLGKIEASYCKNLTSVSNSIYKLLPNISIDLQNCPKLLQLPQAESSSIVSSSYKFLNFSAVNIVDFSGNKFVSLSINTFKFIHISFLKLNNCERLVEIPELPHTLRKLDARNCKSLVRFSQFQFDDQFEGDFGNCHKILVENEKKNWREMVEKEWKMERKENKRKREAVNKGPFNEDDDDMWRYNIMVPGNKIPEWFSYAFNCEDNYPSFHLPSSLINPNLIAIASSAIFQSPQSIFNISFSMCRGAFFNTYTAYNLFYPLESEHMWFGFKYVDFKFPKLWEAEKIFCTFDCDAEEEAALKRVGLHLIYKN